MAVLVGGEEVADPPAAPRAARGRLLSVQGLRAIAVIYVILYHAGLPLPGGFVGVDVFFVISGFVICRLLVNELDSKQHVSFGHFYRRRVRRLLPALAATVCVVLLFSMAFESPIQTQSDTAVVASAASLWLANIALYVVTSGYFAVGVNPSLLHTWSLGVEEQFYLVFPALMAALWYIGTRFKRRAADPRRFLVVIIAVISVLSFLINYWLCFRAPNTIPAPTGIAFFFPFTRGWEFGAGAIVALWISRRGAPGPAASAVAAGCGLLGVAASGALINQHMVFPGVIALVPVLSTAVLILGIVGAANPVARLLSTRQAVTVGDMSYSLYLWHWPFISFAITLWGRGTFQQTVAAALCLPAAYASWRWIERPIREDKKLVWRTPALMAPCIAAPLVLAGVLGYCAHHHWWNPRIADLAAQVDPKGLATKGCQSLTPVSDRTISTCTFAGDSRPPVILMGDSNAGEYADGLVAAGRAAHRTVIIATFPGCALNLVEVYQVGGSSGGCLSLARNALQWAAHYPGATVLVAAANEYVDGDSYGLSDPATGSRSSDTAKKEAIWRDGLIRTYDQLEAAGLKVVQVTSIPHFLDGGLWHPFDCNNLVLEFHFSDCGEHMSLAHGNYLHRFGLAAEQAAAATAGAGILDLRDAICPHQLCSTNWGRFWVYREGQHISVGMSRRLAGRFAPVVESPAAGSSQTRAATERTRRTPQT